MRPTADELRKQYFGDGELKPCPFCGSAAVFKVFRSPEYETEDPNDGGEYVECANLTCRASTPLLFPLMDDVKLLLIERWNRRV